jgi:hypothetical protein
MVEEWVNNGEQWDEMRILPAGFFVYTLLLKMAQSLSCGFTQLQDGYVP